MRLKTLAFPLTPCVFAVLVAVFLLSTRPDNTLAVGVPTPVAVKEAVTEDAFPLDLNRASVQELAELPQIGPTRAAAIVDYRERNGFFLTTDEILNVYGIGDGIYEKIRDMITVSLPA